jgi:phospholipase A1
MRPIPALRFALASALAAGCIGTPEESVLPSAPAGGGLTERWELDAASTREPNYIRPHRQNYALLARWSDEPNQDVLNAAAGAVDATPLQSVELEYQLSFKVKLLNDTLLGGDVWAAYNQLSHWQAYNWSQSAPFRETNYEPELIWTLPVDESVLGLRARLINVGFTHQSNGRGELLSRSWNRLWAQAGFERGPFALFTRGWWRIPESSSDDNNPDIERFLGYGDVLGVYRYEQHLFTLLLRHNLDFDEGRGAVQFDWSFPLASEGNGGLRGYIQVFSGYGETLLDYDYSQTAIGVGIILVDAL